MSPPVVPSAFEIPPEGADRRESHTLSSHLQGQDTCVKHSECLTGVMHDGVEEV